MQDSWKDILALALDVSPGTAPGKASAAFGPGAAVRRHAARVLDAVYRNGLMPPWDLVPHLIALLTDPARCRYVPVPACMVRARQPCSTACQACGRCSVCSTALCPTSGSRMLLKPGPCWPSGSVSRCWLAPPCLLPAQPAPPSWTTLALSHPCRQTDRVALSGSGRPRLQPHA